MYPTLIVFSYSSSFLIQNALFRIHSKLLPWSCYKPTLPPASFAELDAVPAISHNFKIDHMKDSKRLSTASVLIENKKVQYYPFTGTISHSILLHWFALLIPKIHTQQLLIATYKLLLNLCNHSIAYRSFFVNRFLSKFSKSFQIVDCFARRIASIVHYHAF